MTRHISRTIDRCRVFAGAVAEGGIVKGIRVPDGQRISNSRVKPKGDIASEQQQLIAEVSSDGGGSAYAASHWFLTMPRPPALLSASVACLWRR